MSRCTCVFKGPDSSSRRTFTRRTFIPEPLLQTAFLLPFSSSSSPSLCRKQVQRAKIRKRASVGQVFQFLGIALAFALCGLCEEVRLPLFCSTGIYRGLYTCVVPQLYRDIVLCPPGLAQQEPASGICCISGQAELELTGVYLSSPAGSTGGSCCCTRSANT